MLRTNQVIFAVCLLDFKYVIFSEVRVAGIHSVEHIYIFVQYICETNLILSFGTLIWYSHLVANAWFVAQRFACVAQ